MGSLRHPYLSTIYLVPSERYTWSSLNFYIKINTQFSIDQVKMFAAKNDPELLLLRHHDITGEATHGS